MEGVFHFRKDGGGPCPKFSIYLSVFNLKYDQCLKRAGARVGSAPVPLFGVLHLSIKPSAAQAPAVQV